MQVMVRVIMTWDIQDGKEQEYIEFAVGELGPTLGALGLQIKDVWYTVVGSGPEMVVLGEMRDRNEAQGLFASRDWSQLEKRLLTFVENIKVKFVRPKGPFQL
jgi:hypothetical protein